MQSFKRPRASAPGAIFDDVDLDSLHSDLAFANPDRLRTLSHQESECQTICLDKSIALLHVECSWLSAYAWNARGCLH